MEAGGCPVSIDGRVSESDLQEVCLGAGPPGAGPEACPIPAAGVNVIPFTACLVSASECGGRLDAGASLSVVTLGLVLLCSGDNTL